jgi:GH24 family phage-related lysozyme (muramidase)
MAEDDFEGDLFSLALAAAGFFIFVNLVRSFSAAGASTGGLSFPGIAPGADIASMLGIPYTISDAGRASIKRLEGGFAPNPYKDGPGQSVGWGHQILPTDRLTFPLSFDQGEALFDGDIAKVEAQLNSTVNVPLNQAQVDALGDFIFRIGSGNWQKSATLQLLNQGDYAGAAQAFNHFIRTNGQVSSALQDRAAAEQSAFSGVG